MTRRPDAHEQDYIELLADAVCRHGLCAPALVALEAGQPFAFLAAQIVWLAQPALSLITSRRSISQFAELLEQPEAVQALVSAIAARSH